MAVNWSLYYAGDILRAIWFCVGKGKEMLYEKEKRKWKEMLYEKGKRKWKEMLYEKEKGGSYSEDESL